MYMEISKAFDKTLHSRLIQNIRMHGIHNVLIAWILKLEGIGENMLFWLEVCVQWCSVETSFRQMWLLVSNLADNRKLVELWTVKVAVNMYHRILISHYE